MRTVVVLNGESEEVGRQTSGPELGIVIYVVGRQSRGAGVRQIYHGEIRRDPGIVTVAMYQGDGAEEESYRNGDSLSQNTNRYGAPTTIFLITHVH
ncbi:hypothetical protein MSAN_01514900 [Mycena sanguinolenta]|uniref:Uncharacterized protein n=1 Tax=Mycena sanguinolenta TaxID=230812 RepID=A0A8H6Y7Z6_9AGAR|nr:hypothetical protein MSAN_01514900 [Mycena sanguinolenta]